MFTLIFDSGKQFRLTSEEVQNLIDANGTPKVRRRFEQDYLQFDGFIVAINRGADWRPMLRLSPLPSLV